MLGIQYCIQLPFDRFSAMVKPHGPIIKKVLIHPVIGILLVGHQKFL